MQAWMVRKCAMWERGEKLPSQRPTPIMRCPCGELFDNHRLEHTLERWIIRGFDRIAGFAALAFVIGSNDRRLPPHRATTLQTGLRWRKARHGNARRLLFSLFPNPWPPVCQIPDVAGTKPSLY